MKSIRDVVEEDYIVWKGLHDATLSLSAKGLLVSIAQLEYSHFNIDDLKRSTRSKEDEIKAALAELVASQYVFSDGKGRSYDRRKKA